MEANDKTDILNELKIQKNRIAQGLHRNPSRNYISEKCLSKTNTNNNKFFSTKRTNTKHQRAFTEFSNTLTTRPKKQLCTLDTHDPTKMSKYIFLNKFKIESPVKFYRNIMDNFALKTIEPNYNNRNLPMLQNLTTRNKKTYYNTTSQDLDYYNFIPKISIYKRKHKSLGSKELKAKEKLLKETKRNELIQDIQKMRYERFFKRGLSLNKIDFDFKKESEEFKKNSYVNYLKRRKPEFQILTNTLKLEALELSDLLKDMYNESFNKMLNCVNQKDNKDYFYNINYLKK